MQKVIKSMVMLLLLSNSSNVMAQVAGGITDGFQKMTDILPPAPNAASIIKNGTLAVNNNTGAVSVNIPLMSVSNVKLATGISLSYGSSGIKVDELSGRVGMGWSLNAGGVITRTVRGLPDEWNTRIAPPAAPLAGNQALFDFFNTINTTNSPGGFDAEPDLYSFNVNGISGSFILDNNKEPILIPASKIKIEPTFSPTNNSSFIITNTDGVKYYLGGTGATEKTKRETSCGRSYDAYVENAWYLTKIEYPTSEKILFSYTALEYSYDQGLSESVSWGWPMVDFNAAPGSITTTCEPNSCPVGGAAPYACANLVKTQGVLLSSINAGNGITYYIQYKTRGDCNDKLVDYISESIDAVQTRKFTFTYDEQQSSSVYLNKQPEIIIKTDSNKLKTTPYLVRLDETGQAGSATQTHYFTYQNPSLRPPRLSFSQDHWGYFNGKVNTVFIPQPKDDEQRAKFPLATANREVNTTTTGNGLLNKIVYPTGGTEVIHYENNEENIFTDPETYSTAHELTWGVMGPSSTTSPLNTEVVYFTIDHAQVPTLTMNCTATGSTDPIWHYYGEIYIDGPVDPANPSAPLANVYHQVYNPPYINMPAKIYMPGTQQTIPAGTYKCTLLARGDGVTNLIKVAYNTGTTTVPGTNGIVGGMRVKRIITTASIADLPTVKRYYYGELATKNISSLYHVAKPQYYKTTKSTMACTASTGGDPFTMQAYCYGAVLFSNSLNGLFNFSGSPVSYGAVVEAVGENMEGGATETKYFARADEPGYTMWGDEVPGGAMSNFSSIFNGQMKEQTIYKTTALGTQVPLQKKILNYTLDNRIFNTYKGYSVNRKYNIIVGIPIGNPPSTPVDPDVVNAYDLMGYEIYQAWVHPDTVTNITYDENGANPVTSISLQYYENTAHLQVTKTEETNSKAQKLTTSFKYPGDFSGNATYDGMVAQNILEPVINTKQKLTEGLTTTQLAENQTDYALNFISGEYLPSTIKTAVKGNTLETEGTIDVYDANGNVLQFTNKSGISTAILYGYGGKYPVAKIEGSTYNNAITQLSSADFANLPTLDGQALRDAIQTIRAALPTARVTCFTYKKGIGIASITDVENRTNTYEYDAFNRLKIIRDQDGNVVKKHEYNFAGAADPATTITIYYSAAITDTAICNNCVATYGGTIVSYTVPYGSYYSLVSQTDANTQAAADVSANKQLNANKYGKCVKTGPW